ncbi:hypothetical protein [Salmonella phage SD-6_S16]|nr:hypothetical protein [Salmonella phage SD-6_S16]
MSRSIAAAGRYKFGECGYVVDGAILNDGTRLKNIRIYRQRSHRLYDLVDPRTNIIYRKVQITTKDNKGYLLNYNKTNDQLLSEINKNCFFVRGYSEEPQETDTGFVYKFMLHKTILGSSQTLYHMYTPECGIIDRDIDNILISPVFVGNDSISGKLFNKNTLLPNLLMMHLQFQLMLSHNQGKVLLHSLLHIITLKWWNLMFLKVVRILILLHQFFYPNLNLFRKVYFLRLFHLMFMIVGST